MDIYKLLVCSIDAEVTYSRSGGGTGSIWLIKFANKTSLWINCSWRIGHNGQILATEYDDATAMVGRLVTSVRQLEGKKLISFQLSKQNDLKLFFEDGYCTEIFCNISFSSTEDGSTFNTNWEYSMEELDILARVTNLFQIEFEKYYS